MMNSTVAYQLEHPEDNRQAVCRIVTGVMLALATVSMGLRVLSRKMKDVKLTWEDYAMFGGWAFFVVYCGFMYHVVTKGFARHTVYITDVKGFTLALLPLEVSYNPSIICIKASILILYNRLFEDRRLKWISLGLWSFTCAYSIAQFFCEIFSCYPIASNWDPTIKGRCINLALVVTICSILNIITDLVMLSLPMPYLWRLQMSTTRKTQLSGIFLLGGFVCFVSIYRATLVHTVSLIDPAWSDVDGALWSGIELSVAIISGNLPVMRPIYNKVFNHHGTSNSGTERKTYAKSSLSYPKLRPGNISHDNTISHGDFERLGRGTDEVSLEPLNKKGHKEDAIYIRTSIEQMVV